MAWRQANRQLPAGQAKKMNVPFSSLFFFFSFSFPFTVELMTGEDQHFYRYIIYYQLGLSTDGDAYPNSVFTDPQLLATSLSHI